MGIAYLTPEEIAQQHAHIEGKLHEQPNYFVRAGVLDILVSKLIKKDAHIVEIGIGQGSMTYSLLEKGYRHIIGVDIDNYLKDDLQSKVAFQKKDICFQPLDIPDHSQDAVLAIAIMEHLENPLFPFREFTRILKPGGLCMIAIPHIFTLQSRLKFLFHGDVNGYNEWNNHISLHTKSLFKKLFLKDFDVVETHYSRGRVKVFGRKFTAPTVFNKLFGEKVLFVLRKK